MKSMTGFGRADKKTKFGRLNLEISSVNNRFLEFSFRLPRSFQALESKLRELAGKYVDRGKISVTLGYELPEDSEARFHINKEAAHSYIKQLRQIQKEMKLSGDVRISDLVMLPDIARPETDDLDIESGWKALEPVAKKGFSELAAMRKREGIAMANDMTTRLKVMEKLVSEVEKKSDGSAEKQASRLSERISALMESSSFDPARLEQEVAFYADRTDIAEECTRFRSHLKEYASALKQNKPVGRRLNFVLQEMNREINTIGSKSAEFEISSTVISLKEEIEKLRELVQNVE